MSNEPRMCLTVLPVSVIFNTGKKILMKEKGMLKKGLKGLLEYAIVVSMLLPSVAFGQTQQIKEYKVIKGDTLWGIAKKELNDSFLWPKIWKENTSISNPDRLYPGETIRIPLYLIQKAEPETAPKPAAPAEAPAKEMKKEQPAAVEAEYPLVERDLLLAGGYISDTVPAGVGRVGDSPSGRTLLGDNDSVYVSVYQPVQTGERFYVIKVSEPVLHPVTGRKVGYVVKVTGVAEIKEIRYGETLAKLIRCFGEINTGDMLVPYYEIEPPMTNGHFRTPDFNGMIIAGNRQALNQSKLDVVYIDRGCGDGIEAGDIFTTLHVGEHAVPNGTIQVIGCKDHTATAVIKNNSDPITAGDIFAQFDRN